MDYYNEIKDSLIKSEFYDKVIDYTKDISKVRVYLKNEKLLHDVC